MQSQESVNVSLRSSGRFFLLLVAVSLVFAFINFYQGLWSNALRLVPGMLVFGGLAWWALAGIARKNNPEQPAGGEEAGVLVPAGRGPTHHLVAAKDLPPSDRTHTFPKD